MSEDLREATVRGLSWTGMAQVVGYLIQISALGVAARHLETGAFGAEIAAATVVGTGTIAADLGLGRALVQRRDLTPAHLAAAFWLGLVAASGLAILLSSSASLWGEVFRNRQVAGVLPTMAYGLLFTGVGSVPRAQLERSFKFDKLALIDLASAICSGGILILLSVSGYGLWSLVWGFVVRSCVSGVVPWVVAPFPASFRFNLKEGRELLGFGWKWVGARLVGYGQQNLDYVMIGRYLGDEALGYYSLAYRLIAFPQMRLVQVVSRVTFPAFASLQLDLDRLRSAYRTTITYIALVAFPAMVGFSLLADPGIILLYGSGMTKSIVLLQLLVPAGALRSVAAPAGLIYSALGRTGLALNWNIFAACVMVGALVLGLKGGVEGVALAVSLSAILLALVSQFLVQRLVGFTMGEFFRSLAPAIGGSLGMLVCVITFKWIFLPNLPIWLFLPCCVLIGMSAYVASIRFLGRGIFYEATGLLQAALRRH